MQQFIAQYGYLAVFVLMLAESACIPVPSEVIMLFAGALAAGAVAGVHLSLAGVIVVGVLGNVAGSYVAWAVGKYAGQAAARRWGRRIGIREREIDRATAWFQRHGPAAVLIGRVIPVIRTFISLPAGFASMPAVRFGVYTTLGCIPWTAALGIAGYELGANWATVANGFHAPTYIIAGIVVVAVAAAVIVWFRRARRGETGTPATRGETGTPATRGETGTPATRGETGSPGSSGRDGTPGTSGGQARRQAPPAPYGRGGTL